MKKEKMQDYRLVSETTENLRNLIISHAPDAYLGSMNEVAKKLGVGIVTVQQAARILEHEGLLNVKRGPGGGYYGTRPDAAALERAFATYMRIHNISYRDAFEMTVSLDCDIAEHAAGSKHKDLEPLIEELIEELERCQSAEDRIEFEVHFRDALLKIVCNPLLELLSRVAMQLYKSDSDPALFADRIRLEEWKVGRMAILQAIMRRDSELAFFEAQRFRRRVQTWMQLGPSAAHSPIKPPTGA